MEISIEQMTGAFLAARLVSRNPLPHTNFIHSRLPYDYIPGMYTPQVITHPSTPLRPLLAFAGLPLHFPLLLTCHASRPDGMKSECYSSFVTETNGREWTMAHFVAGVSLSLLSMV
ncbi:hypothetical protein K439DRAFT_419785 [Ramaria rubella]|nr:hypothetical protein K439DRAFT_419785 [Ramaria rubella]